MTINQLVMASHTHIAPTTERRVRPQQPVDEPQPGKPDWLMVLVVGLFLLTLLIAWLTDIPVILR